MLIAGIVFAQEASQQKPANPPNSGDISVQDVCAAALPRAAQGKQFQWSPDGKTIAYFQPTADSYGLRMELDAVSAEGGERRVLVTSKSVNELFPPKPDAHRNQTVPPPKETIGFQWSADGRGLLLFSNLHIFWLDAKTLQTTSLVSGEEPISDIQLSPDGRSAAFVRSHNLWIVKTTGGAATSHHTGWQRNIAQR